MFDSQQNYIDQVIIIFFLILLYVVIIELRTGSCGMNTSWLQTVSKFKYSKVSS